MRRSKGYVRVWCTAEFLAVNGTLLKNKRILAVDLHRDCYLVEARKFRWPK